MNLLLHVLCGDMRRDVSRFLPIPYYEWDLERRAPPWKSEDAYRFEKWTL